MVERKFLHLHLSFRRLVGSASELGKGRTTRLAAGSFVLFTASPGLEAVISYSEFWDGMEFLGYKICRCRLRFRRYEVLLSTLILQ